MPGKIDWSFNVVVAGGPKFSASRSVEVDAYDKVDATIPKKDGSTAGTATVSVQPSGAGKVQILLITSSVYDDKLTYKVDGGTDIKLDQPQVLVGDGAVALLNQTQKEFVFKNELEPAADASIQIFVGRNAV